MHQSDDDLQSKQSKQSKQLIKWHYFYSIHLGFISTNIGPEGFIRNFVMMFARSPDIGAINVMYPALDPKIDEGEKYFEDCKEVKANDQALDEELAKKFWEKFEELLNNYDLIF
ncbi:hypothetical protein C2G38_2030692 [Gigaspora rosea]|uniref:Uncharacterized protein n=1 Tax=Gigaspora rosea TaxID=44941 RepID=A0A397VTG1_9GLOM|nr:hypothetical protein C2G38_2030692 [Gigaspora rosea]